MKLTLLLLSCLMIDTAFGLKCWTCADSKDNWECYATGELKQCDINELSCENEIRVDKRYDTVNFRRVVVSSLVRVRKGCKQTEACKNNEVQNDRTSFGNMTWDKGQCNFSPLNTVCRCCCETDSCNLFPLYCRPHSLDRSISYSFNRPDDQGAAGKRHPCDEVSNPCGNGGKCIKGDGFEYSCRCRAAWLGDDHCNTPSDHNKSKVPLKLQLEQVNEQQMRAAYAESSQLPCVNFNPCGNEAKCVAGLEGGYTCECKEGWTDAHCNTPIVTIDDFMVIEDPVAMQ